MIRGGTTTSFIGNIYEASGSNATKYYYAGASRVAMRANSTLYFLLTDNLGSTTVTTDGSGNLVSELKYKPWGEVRSGSSPTSYTYTGQYSNLADFGLMYYNARWYDPALARFAQADGIVPEGVQGYDRYAYVGNSPVNYTDPSGHREECGTQGEVCHDERKAARKLEAKAKKATQGGREETLRGPLISTPPPIGTPMLYDPTLAPGYFPDATSVPGMTPAPLITGEDLWSWFDNLTGPSPASSPLGVGLNELFCKGTCQQVVDGGLLTLNGLAHAAANEQASRLPYHTPTVGPSATASATPQSTATPSPHPTSTSPYITPTYTQAAATPTSWFLP